LSAKNVIFNQKPKQFHSIVSQKGKRKSLLIWLKIKLAPTYANQTVNLKYLFIA
jgi:hypothetical protein